MEMDISFGM